MARISGVDLPREKKVEIGLTYIYGIGRETARRIIAAAGVSPDQRIKDLSDADVNRLRQALAKTYRTAGAPRTLPTRGQRTHTSARTKKGPRRAIAGKKKVTK